MTAAETRRVRPTASEHAERHRALGAGAFEPKRIVARHHTGRLVVGIVVVLVFASVVWTIVSRPALQWGTVGTYLFNRQILGGLVVTIYLTIIAMAIAVVLGSLVALMTQSKNPILVALGLGYVWLFRAIPGLVQLLIWFNLASLFPTIEIGIPYVHMFFGISPNAFMTPLLAACLGLGLSEGAYVAEIIRGGLLSIPNGQHEAASALGLTSGQTMRKVVLPQAMRMIIPPIGNQFIGMLKYTSLASVVSVGELLHAAQSIYTTNFQIIPLLVVASIWYLVLTTVLTFLQRRVEAYFNRGFDGRSTVPVRRTPFLSGILGRRRPVEPSTSAQR